MNSTATRFLVSFLVLLAVAAQMEPASAQSQVSQVEAAATSAKQAVNAQAKASKAAAKQKATQEKQGATPAQVKVINKKLAITNQKIENRARRARNNIDRIAKSIKEKLKGGLTDQQFQSELARITNAKNRGVATLAAIICFGRIGVVGKLSTIVVTILDIKFNREGKKKNIVTSVSVKVKVETTAPPITRLRGSFTFKYSRAGAQIRTPDGGAITFLQPGVKVATFVIASTGFPNSRGPFPGGPKGVVIRVEVLVLAQNSIGESDRDESEAEEVFSK